MAADAANTNVILSDSAPEDSAPSRCSCYNRAQELRQMRPFVHPSISTTELWIQQEFFSNLHGNLPQQLLPRMLCGLSASAVEWKLNLDCHQDVICFYSTLMAADAAKTGIVRVWRIGLWVG